MSSFKNIATKVVNIGNKVVTKQKMGGKVYTTIEDGAVRTKMITSNQNGVAKIVKRRLNSGKVFFPDETIIKTAKRTNLKDKYIDTINETCYAYSNTDDGLSIFNEEGNFIYSKKDGLIGSICKFISNWSDNSKSVYKEFYDKNRKLLKRVEYDFITGQRVFAKKPNGEILRFDEKGLPSLTDAKGNKADFGGLDSLF